MDDNPVLILGGTTEGYALADTLAGRPGLVVVSSLAGRTANPRRPAGDLRVGGFGGAMGLAAYLRANRIGAVIDATHPFAARMGWNAAAGCRDAGVPLLRLERPAWMRQPGDHWDEVADWDEAAALVGRRASRVLLALGRQELAPFAALDHVWFLVRSVDAPDPMPPFAQAELLLARGPFTLVDERALLGSREIDTLVCKNSGGGATDAKLQAARELGVRVVMRRRPPRPDLPVAATVGAAVGWLEALLASARNPTEGAVGTNQNHRYGVSGNPALSTASSSMAAADPSPTFRSDNQASGSRAKQPCVPAQARGDEPASRG